MSQDHFRMYQGFCGMPQPATAGTAGAGATGAAVGGATTRVTGVSRRSEEGLVFEIQDHSLLNSSVLPAPHRRGLQERGAPAKQAARYWFDLQFRFVRLLNIPILTNPEHGSKHTDIWTRFVFRTTWTK
jgi:hypothetical protein